MKSLPFESSQTLFFLTTLISILVLWASTRICLLNAACRAWLAYIFKLYISSHDLVLKVSALRSQINFSYIIFPCWSCCDWIKRSKLGNIYPNSQFQNIEAGSACWSHSSPCVPRMQRDHLPPWRSPPSSIPSGLPAHGTMPPRFMADLPSFLFLPKIHFTNLDTS